MEHFRKYNPPLAVWRSHQIPSKNAVTVCKYDTYALLRDFVDNSTIFHKNFVDDNMANLV